MSAPIRLLYGLIAGCLFAVFLFGGQMATLYTDWVWFEALSFGGCFSDNLHVTLWVGIRFGCLVLRLLASNIWLSLRQRRPEPVQLLFPSELDDSPMGGVLRSLPPSAPFLIIAGFVSFVMGLAGSAAWDELLLYLNQTSFGFSEPILGLEASFYVFSLPLYTGLRGFLFAVSVVAMGVVLLAYFSRGAIELDFVQVEPGQYVVQGGSSDPAARAFTSPRLRPGYFS